MLSKRSVVQVRADQKKPPRNPPRISIQQTGGGPVIESYSPSFGHPGTVVTINGRGFGSVQGDSYVTVLSAKDANTYTTWPATSWSDTQITVPVPLSMPFGKVFLAVEVNEQKSPDWHPFTVGIPPLIATYSPAYGAPGTPLTITGTGFGASQGSSYVTVLSAVTRSWIRWTPTSWSDTQITVPVPLDMPPGKVFLYVNVNTLDTIGTYAFTVGIPPSIGNYSPAFGDQGTVITFSGSGFGGSQGSSYVAAISATTGVAMKWPTTNWNDHQIVVPVPSTAPLGKYYLYVNAAGLDSIGTYPFTVGTPPAIESYAPACGAPGTLVTINGKGFGQSQGSGRVAVLSAVTNAWATWTPISWSDTEVVVSVPSNMPLGRVYLYVNADGLESVGTYAFTVGVPPQILSYSPLSGPDGTVLTINGRGFGDTQGSGYVTLQSASNVWTTLTSQSWSDTQIVVAVPTLTVTGLNYLSITTGGLQSIGTYPFIVQ